ncbi:MAG: hypothetical protein ACRD0K_14770 [Egibacteraceae bacterium]
MRVQTCGDDHPSRGQPAIVVEYDGPPGRGGVAGSRPTTRALIQATPHAAKRARACASNTSTGGVQPLAAPWPWSRLNRIRASGVRPTWWTHGERMWSISMAPARRLQAASGPAWGSTTVIAPPPNSSASPAHAATPCGPAPTTTTRRSPLAYDTAGQRLP